MISTELTEAEANDLGLKPFAGPYSPKETVLQNRACAALKARGDQYCIVKHGDGYWIWAPVRKAVPRSVQVDREFATKSMRPVPRMRRAMR